MSTVIRLPLKTLRLAAYVAIPCAVVLACIWLWAEPGSESTNDAYVTADFTLVASRIAGQLSDVPVADNQQVKAGQLLARIDDRDFRAALMSAEADVAAARASVANYDAEIARHPSLVDQGAQRFAPTKQPSSSRRQTHRATAIYPKPVRARRRNNSVHRARSPSNSHSSRAIARYSSPPSRTSKSSVPSATRRPAPWRTRRPLLSRRS